MTFPERKLHAAMAAGITDKVVSAGFARYSSNPEHYECYGHSESLKIASRSQDSDILNKRAVDRAWSHEK